MVSALKGRRRAGTLSPSAYNDLVVSEYGKFVEKLAELRLAEAEISAGYPRSSSTASGAEGGSRTGKRSKELRYMSAPLANERRGLRPLSWGMRGVRTKSEREHKHKSLHGEASTHRWSRALARRQKRRKNSTMQNYNLRGGLDLKMLMEGSGAIKVNGMSSSGRGERRLSRRLAAHNLTRAAKDALPRAGKRRTEEADSNTMNPIMVREEDVQLNSDLRRMLSSSSGGAQKLNVDTRSQADRYSGFKRAKAMFLKLFAITTQRMVVGERPRTLGGSGGAATPGMTVLVGVANSLSAADERLDAAAAEMIDVPAASGNGTAADR